MSAKLSSKAHVTGRNFLNTLRPQRSDMMRSFTHTGKKLKEIGLQFGIVESGVSQSCKRVAQKIEKDKKLKKKIGRLEKQIYMSRMKT
jgi:hypothetical protein